MYARQGMVKTINGRMVSGGSMAKYGEAVRLYGTTSGSLRSLALRFGVNECSLRDFIKRHFPEAVEGHRRAVERERECKAAGAAGSGACRQKRRPSLRHEYLPRIPAGQSFVRVPGQTRPSGCFSRWR